MKKRNLSMLEREYKRFDILSKIVLFALLGLMMVIGLFFIFSKSDEFKILFGLFLVLGAVIIIFIALKITNKRTAYLQKINDEKNRITRTGLFKDVYEAHKHDGFEFNLIYDKLLFDEYHNTIVNIGLVKNNHEFLIEIYENFISITVDEETEHPFEVVMPLSDISTIEHLYSRINEFINSYSTC